MGGPRGWEESCELPIDADEQDRRLPRRRPTHCGTGHVLLPAESTRTWGGGRLALQSATLVNSGGSPLGGGEPVEMATRSWFPAHAGVGTVGHLLVLRRFRLRCHRSPVWCIYVEGGNGKCPWATLGQEPGHRGSLAHAFAAYAGFGRCWGLANRKLARSRDSRVWYGQWPVE